MYCSHFSRCPKIIQTSFHLYPLHKHRCHERRPRLTPAPSASLFSHCGIFSKLFNTINSIHRVEVSLKKSEGAQEQDEEREKESAYSVHRTWDCFLGPSIRMELTGRVHPLQQSQSEGVRRGRCGMTARPSAGQWDNGGAPSSPRAQETTPHTKGLSSAQHPQPTLTMI